MSKACFSLDMASRACSPGLEEARRLFEPSRTYTASEIVRAGLQTKNLVWLLMDRSSKDKPSLQILQKWARRCSKETGLPDVNPGTARAAISIVRDAMRERIRQMRKVRGVREWANAQLIEIIESKEI